MLVAAFPLRAVFLPTRKRKAPPTTAKKRKTREGMFKVDQRVEVEFSKPDEDVTWLPATIVSTRCDKKSHYKVLYDEPEGDAEEDRMEEVPVARISEWGEAGQARRDKYVRKDASGRKY